MPGLGHDVTRGLEALREAVSRALLSDPPLAVAAGPTDRRTPSTPTPHPLGWLLSETVAGKGVGASDRPQGLDQGQRVWLVTAAPIEIATIIARRLGLTGALGTVSEHVDGVYTGELVGEMLHGSAKAVAVKGVAERFGLDLARCSAYSDSYNDLPMLNEVGDPCAINPDARLREYARANGWRIRDYRTGRKAARAGLFTAAVAGAVAGTVAAGAAIRRKVS